MQDAFGIVIFAVVIGAAIVAVITLFGRSKAYEQIGRGGLSLNEDPMPKAATGAVALRERDDEIRQMLDARNARRQRRGEAPLDVEAELARLTAPGVAEPGRPPVTARFVAPGLEAEVRQLVIARNDRRERRGQPPLDVEEEV